MTSYAETFTEERLQEIVRRIVEVADPVKIVLFGSAARGEMGPHSDADFLVIVKPGVDRGQVAGDVYKNMRSAGQALDVVVVTTEDVEKYRDSPAVVIYPALREGRVVYEEHGPRNWGAAGGGGTPTSNPDERRLDDPAVWLDHARSNLIHAHQHDPGVMNQILCFDAHQAAEKALKALLIHRTRAYPYTHDLGRLLSALKESEVEVPDAVAEAAPLTRYATETRYPAADRVTDDEYLSALQLATTVVEWVQEQLGQQSG